MNLSRQIKTTKKEALAFVRYMEGCGYESHDISHEGISDIHFTKDGKVTIHSIKRLSDGEVFTVDDDCSCFIVVDIIHTVTTPETRNKQNQRHSSSWWIVALSKAPSVV